MKTPLRFWPRMRFGVVLLVLALFGCVQADSPPVAPPSAPTVALLGCANMNAAFPVPVAAAQAALPAGFVAKKTGGSAIDGALMYVVVARCESGIVNGADVGESLIGYAELDVVPPAALASGNDHVAPVFFAASPPALGDALASLRLGRAGAATIERVALPGGSAEFTVKLGEDGYRLAGVVQPATSALTAGAFRVFGVQDAQLRTIVDGTYSAGTAQAATLVLSPIGNPPLIDQSIRPAARGGAVSGFDLGFSLSPTQP